MEIKSEYIDPIIIGMWRQGATIKEICYHLKVDATTVEAMIKSYKIKLKKKEVLCENGKNNS